MKISETFFGLSFLPLLVTEENKANQKQNITFINKQTCNKIQSMIIERISFIINGEALGFVLFQVKSNKHFAFPSAEVCSENGIKLRFCAAYFKRGDFPSGGIIQTMCSSCKWLPLDINWQTWNNREKELAE